MIVITGGAGFIGSAIATGLNRAGMRDLLIADHLGEENKWRNLVRADYIDFIHKDIFLSDLRRGKFDGEIEAIIHMGACSSTTETDADYLMENNFQYSRELALWALDRDIRFIYASSAATYGDGSAGFSDDLELLNSLIPLNMYGYSKHLMDLWARKTGALEEIVGLKFFNVFGPNEYHKGGMRSMVIKAWEQAKTTGSIRLFKSLHPDYGDGEQKRDFIYIKDVVEMIIWLLYHPDINGLFNIGTGQARSWNDLAQSVFAAMKLPPVIEYIDMPDELKDSYQYFTEAEMTHLTDQGCPCLTTSLEDAVEDYILHYLDKGYKTLSPRE